MAGLTLAPSRLLIGLTVVLDDDARAARKPLTFLSTLPPSVKSFVRQGLTEEDVTTLSDRRARRLGKSPAFQPDWVRMCRNPQ